jgi:ferredoxin
MSASTAIYYFSATGNSLAVALELAQKMGAPEPISIPGTLLLEDPYEAARTADRVGFVFPVHRATLPEMVLGFIEMMPKRKDCYYFAVSTYTVFGCNEFWDIEEALGAEGSFLNYAVGIKTMGNVGLMDPDTKVIDRRITSISKHIDEIVDEINNFQESSFRRSVKLLGVLVKKFTQLRRKSIVFHVDKRCKKCGICAQVCPANNIVIGEDGDVAPIRSDKCQACYACLHWCPANAIGTRRLLHAHYHHPNIKPDQLNTTNPVQSKPNTTEEKVATGTAKSA